MTITLAYAALSHSTPLVPFTIERREPTSDDVQIEILYCGVCHSDIHQVRNEWGCTMFPIVPGHEIIGKVTATGGNVSKFKIGDLVGVGCFVNSCGHCTCCEQHLEQYCNQVVFTCNSPDAVTGGVTHGGYSKSIVVKQSFVLHIPDKLDPAKAAPLLCAGITMYSPLKHWHIGKGDKVGIVGSGGLGHIGIQFAHALGAEVVLFTTSANKIGDGKRLGADSVVISTDTKAMLAYKESFDFILDTVSAAHHLDAYTDLLKLDGTLCLVGLPEKENFVPTVFNLVNKRRSIAGSSVGGIQETQEMLDFCVEHNIAAEVEMITIQQINQAYQRMLKNEVKYRFVIDLSSLVEG